MEDGWIRTIAELCGTGLMTVGGYHLRRHNTRMTAIESAAEKDRTALAEHKLESEKRFAKEETIQHSLERIHNRLDDIVNLVVRSKP